MSNPETVASNHVTSPSGSGLAFAVGCFFSSRVVTTLFSVRVLGTDPQTGAEIRLALNLLFLGFVCFALLGTEGRSLRSLLRLSTLRWVLVYLVFSGCSLLWSEAASPLASAAYWCGTAIDVAMVVLLLRASVPGVAGALMKGFVWGACLVAVIAWLMPTQYDLRLGDEEYLNANTIANLCAFAIFFSQYLTHTKQGKWWPTAAFLAITLLRSLSKTTIVAFVLSESLLVIQDRDMSRRAKVLLTLAVMLAILVSWGLLEAYYDFYTTYGNQAETLTGRTAIWAYVVEAVVQRPWIGHGFDSMWKIVPRFGSFEARHAENEVLEQLYSYGIAGIVMLTGVYGSLYRRIRTLPQGLLRVIFASILFFVVIRGLAEAEPFDLLLPLWAVALMCLVVDSADRKTPVVSPPVTPMHPLPLVSDWPSRLSVSRCKSSVASTSLRHMQRQRHGAVARAAEVRAVAHKIAGLHGGEGKLAGIALANLRLQVQLLELDSMSHVLAVKFKHYRLTFLQGDVSRRIRKALGSNLDLSWRARCRCRSRRGHAAPHHESRRENQPGHSSQTHSSLSSRRSWKVLMSPHRLRTSSVRTEHCLKVVGSSNCSCHWAIWLLSLVCQSDTCTFSAAPCSRS